MSLKATQIYARIIDNKIGQDMNILVNKLKSIEQTTKI